MANGVLPNVRISEFHYDNAGAADEGERVEISGPANMSLQGWKLVLYNGASTVRAPYTTTSLDGLVISASCQPRGVVVVSYPTDGIQNGSPDGMALVNATGDVVDLLSYEGSFTAVSGAAGGPAAGKVFPDILVSETNSTPVGSSLKRTFADTWTAPSANSFDACNDVPPATTPVASITVTPTEATIMAGTTQQFNATGFDASGNPIPGAPLTWAIEPSTVASVDASGLALGLEAGAATITVSGPNGATQTTQTATLHVNEWPALPPSPVYVSEIHYDDDGADDGEAIEVEGPAGFDLTGWTVVLYNGNGGASYGTLSLPSTIPANCGARGVVSVTGPTSGIQNGSPDGVALVNQDGVVVEFLSYEGAFRATNGAAQHRKSIDIGVSETDDGEGNSLQRDASGFWDGPIPSTFGACNVTPPQSSATIVINELMADPLRASGGSSWGEWFEVYNYGAAPVNMQGWTISSSGQPEHVIASSLMVPAGGYAVLGRGHDPDLNGGITLDYNYFTASTTTIFLDDTDRLELRDGAGARVDLVRWTSMPLGITRGVRDAAADNVNVNGPNWGFSTATFGDGDFGTPGIANGTLSNTAPTLANFISITGRTPGDVPLPVGFESQIFATLKSGTNDVVPSSFTWTSETPGVASIQPNGVIKALAAGTAIFRARADVDGTARSWSLPMRIAVASSTAQYANNAEFGEPTDGSPADDYIVRYPQYTASYSNVRNTPNWVSYEIDPTHFGDEDRCNCFTFDPSLPFTPYNTADYTGSSVINGFDIARGHLARSFDRTSGSLDNARTFFFTNIVPQAAAMNSGVWSAFEMYLGDKARLNNREVYVITGVAGEIGTLKNLGFIKIPETLWKVAIVLPRNKGLADLHDYLDIEEVVAVIIPNTNTGLSNTWQTYQTTVDAVEAASGYDLLSLLPNNIENAVESNTKPPIARIDAPASASEGALVTISAATSVDPNGTITSYAWTFGDGGTSSDAVATHTFAQNATYTVRLVVTDNDGLVDEAMKTIQVTNVAPSIDEFAGATLLPGETYTASGSFTDPGADSWSATVNYGDGSGVNALALAGKNFSLAHTYAAAGTFTVTVRVTDDLTTSARTQVVTVLTPVNGLQNVIALVNENSLRSKLENAVKSLEKDNVTPAVNQLEAFLNELDAMVKTGRLTEAQAQPMRDGVERVIQSLTR